MDPLYFPKSALTVDQQIDLLIDRGMEIADHNLAHHYLSHINYYRLSAYWLPFEVLKFDGNGHDFHSGTTFVQILELYSFDRELRLLLLDAIERVEVSLRARLANILSLNYGPFAHEAQAIFKCKDTWQASMEDLIKEYKRSRETFAEHYRTEYKQLTTPPIWVACEMMMLGQLSRWLQNLNLPKDRQAIANIYELDEKIFVSFIHHLSIVRNYCAHHARVWNRKFSLKMRLPNKKPAFLAAALNPNEDRRIYNTLTMLAYLFTKFSPESRWAQRVKLLIKNYHQVNLSEMGFPPDWLQRAIWVD